MVLIKIHESYRKVVAVCDSSLIGKKFEDEKRQLDLRENFYSGEDYEKEKALEVLRSLSADDATFNIVGDDSIEIAKEAGLINEEAVARVDGIPFALVLL